MSVLSVEGLGPLANLARAIGLLSGDTVQTDWFADPGRYLSRMLREPAQRAALVAALDELLAQGTALPVDTRGRRWIVITRQDPVEICAVMQELSGGDVELGVGARVRSENPTWGVDAYVPLLRVPQSTSSPAIFALGTSAGRAEVAAYADLDAPAPDAVLYGIGISADVPTGPGAGDPPVLAIVLRGLRLGADGARTDVSLGQGGLAALPDEAVRLGGALLRSVAGSAAGHAAALLNLLGLGDDPAIPPLPIPELLTEGLPALQRWLDSLTRDAAALQAWIAQISELVTASVPPARAPAVAGDRISWSLASGAQAGLIVRAQPGPGGATTLDLGGFARVFAAANANPPASASLEVIATRATLGPSPAVVGLPSLVLAARLGPAPDAVGAASLVPPTVIGTVTVEVRALRVGLEIREDRQPRLVLAAERVRVTVGARTDDYPVLDLTRADALVDLGNAVVDAVVDDLLDQLGPAAARVRVALGLDAPAAGWPVPLVSFVDLLARPLESVVDYHRRVMRDNPAGYVEVLGAMAALLSAGGAGAGTGAGTDADPWKVTFAPGVAVAGWRTGAGAGTMHLGLAIDRRAIDLGGSCPTVALGLRVELTRIDMATLAARALGAVDASLLFGARGGIPLRVGTNDAAIVADRIGFRMRLADGTLSAGLAAPGLAAEIDGDPIAFALPTVGPGGAFAAPVPWRALERLAGALLEYAGPVWARELAVLLGWTAGQQARLSLEAAAADPLGAIREFATRLPPETLARLVSVVVNGPASRSLPAGVMLDAGSPAAPLLMPLGRAPAGQPFAFLSIGGITGALRVSRFRPPGLVALATGGSPVLPAAQLGAQLASMLALGGSQGRTAHEAVRGRPDLAAGLTALAERFAAGDGLVRADQATFSGATPHVVEAGQGALATLDLAALTGAPADEQTLFVTLDAAWPGLDAERLIDLSPPALPAAAFDVARLASEPGPWAIRLPSRRDAAAAATEDPTAAQAARLARAIEAVAARAGGGAAVSIVALGAAGHAARIAARTPGVARLVTLGTPHGGIDLGVLDAGPGAQALQLLAGLVPPAGGRAELASLRLGRDLIAPLVAAYRAGDLAIEDLTPPPVATPAIPAGVAAHTVAGRVGAAKAQLALAALVARALQDAFEIEERARREAPSARAPTFGVGRRFEAGDDVAGTGIRVALDARLDLWSLGAAALDPVVVAGIRLSRPGAFLAGGPDPARPAGTRREPSVRRADVEIVVPLLRPAEARSRFVLHDAEALGTRRTRWEISRPSDGGAALDAAARLLIGRAFAALGPLPASGPVREAVEILRALDLLAAPAATGGAVGLSVDAVEQLVADPAAFLAGVRERRGASALASALARVVGAPAPSASSPAVFATTVDGLTVRADLAAGSVAVDAAGLALHSGLGISGSLTLDAAGPRGNLALGVAAAGVALEIGGDPFSVRLRAADTGVLSPPIELYPVVDAAGLARLVEALVPAQVLSAGIAFVRTIDPNVNALVDPLLDAFGMLVRGPDGERVRIPVLLLTSPRAWLDRAAVLGGAGGRVDPDRLIALVGGIGRLLGLAGPTPGTIALPGGVTLAAERSARGAAQLALRASASPGGGLRITGGPTIEMPEPGAAPRLALDAALALDGAAPIQSSARLVARIDAAGSALTLVLGAGNEITLLPPGPGLASSVATAAATYALPLALDAIVGRGGTVGNAVGALGTALGLRVGGNFDGNQILALADDPGAQLATRLRANVGAAFGPLADLVRSSFPAGWNVAGAGSALTVTRAGTLSVTITAPSSGRLALAATAGPFDVFAGAAVSGEIQLTETGLRRLRATFEVAPAAPLAAGPLNLAPGAEVDIGPDAAGGSHVSVWLAANAATRLEGRLSLEPTVGFDLRAPGAPSLALGAVQLLVPMAVDVALSIAEIDALLDIPILASPGVAGRPARDLLDGSILRVVGGVTSFDPVVLDPAQLFPQLLKLARTIALQAPAIVVAPISIRIAPRADNAEIVGITVSLAPGERFILADGDVQVALEVDATWIAPPGDGGVRIDLVRITGAGVVTIAPGFAIRGVGVRVMRKDRPLIAEVVSIGSIALHGYIGVDGTGVNAGGGQIELGSLALPIGGGAGGDNKVASGVLKDAASGSEKPEAAFSPALSLQVGPPPRGATLGLRAGQGDGPWWLGIRRSFGPVYIEQVGLGVENGAGGPRAISVMVDGKISMLGLTVAVDDLALRADFGQPLHLPSAWTVSLAGLSVGADTGGVKIAGGLRRGAGTDYLGMLTVRWAVYGITAFGGYAVKRDERGDYTSFFLFGAVNAPIGGIPAFFVTGIGAGIGINRLLVLPADFSRFTIYPLVAALDPNSPIASNVDAAMTEMERAFPSGRGRFWLAAGISFTSFTLVQGVVVIAIEVGDGLQIALLGLARAALPRPEAALVQIELALLARFSTRDGILWIQGQLTEESWLLVRDCRITGGFAYVMWFTGPRAGEFVLTMGGYHPSFRREGYPEVPRLGFVWNVASVLVIKGENYFALTSEALMVGARFEARLDAGLLWAYVRIGADGIVYFDPFWFQVAAFAEMGAGITITIDLGFFGKIRIRLAIQLSGRVVLEGPSFRGRATIDLDVASAEVSFGNWSGTKPPDLLWAAFKQKYLVQSDDAAAAADIISVTPGRGQQAGSPGPTGANRKPPTGSRDDPFRMVPEFTFEVRSRAAASDLAAGANAAARIANLAVAPMGRPAITSRMTATLRDAAGADRLSALGVTPVRDSFPKGIWVARSDPKAVPAGELVEAYAGWTLLGDADVRGATPEIDYHQVETGPRKPLPFAIESATRSRWRRELGVAADLGIAIPVESTRRYATARTWKAAGARGTADRLAAERARPARRAPPQLVPIAAGSTRAPLRHARPARIAPPRPPAARPDAPPRLEARLVLPPAAVEPARTHTTVSAERKRGLTPVPPPAAGELRARVAAMHGARLVMRTPAAVARGETVLAPIVPVTTRAGSGLERRHAGGRRALDAAAAAFCDRGVALANAEIQVFRLPDAARPRTIPAGAGAAAPSRQIALTGPARVVFFAPMGVFLGSAYLPKGQHAVPEGTERFAILAGARAGTGNIGWHADTTLAQVGETTFIGPGCTMRISSATTWRAGQPVPHALVRAGDMVVEYCRVDTTLDRPVRSLAIVLEPVAGEGSADDIEMELAGATRPAGTLPRLVVAAGRTIAVYNLRRNPAARTIEVGITVTARVRLAGVIGSADAADRFATRLAEDGVDRLLEPLARPTQPLAARWLVRRRAARKE